MAMFDVCEDEAVETARLMLAEVPGSPGLPPTLRADAAKFLMHHLRGEIAALAAQRREAVQEMRDSGRTLAEIGTALGVSRQQVHRILRGKE